MTMLTPTIILAFFSIQINAQSLIGKNVLTTTLSGFGGNINNSKGVSPVNPTQKSRSVSLGLNPELSYGKINNKNVLIAYGIGLTFGYSKNEGESFMFRSSSYGFYPSVTFQKFTILSDKLYFSPLLRTFIGYRRVITDSRNSSSKELTDVYSGTLSFSPFAVTFLFKPNTFFLFLIGNAEVSYAHTESYLKPNLSDSKSINNNFNFSGQINYFSVGIQRIF